jgi:PPP family 3-phenylpropionic acid transporter
VISVWLRPDLKESQPVHERKQPVLPVLRQRPVQWFFAAVFFHVLAHMAVYVFLSLYLDALGYSKTVIGLLWAVSVIVEIGWFFTQSRWLPLLSLTAWLVLCAALMAVRMGLTAAGAGVWWVLLLAQVLHAFTFATHHTACIALLSHHFPGSLRGRGQAQYAVRGYGLAGVLGGLLGGLLSARLGLVSVFWAALASSLLATLCAWQVWRQLHGAHQPPA